VIKKLFCCLGMVALVGCGRTTESSAPAQSTQSINPPAIQTSTLPLSSSKSSNLPAVPVGWRWISGVSASLAVPANYVGGSPENLKAIAANLPEASLDRDALVALLGRYVGPTNLFAIDRSTLSKAFPTNLSVALDGNPKEKDLDSYLANAVKELGSDWQVQKQEKITLGNRQFARIRAIAQKSSVEATIYITNDAGKFWLLTFTAEKGVSNSVAADFQQIAASLRSL
jgi:hypothetical protein